MRHFLRRSLARWEGVLVALLVLIYGLGAALSPYFLSPGNQADIISSQVEQALIVVPMVMIVVAGEIDLSVASIAGFASAVLGAQMLVGVPFEIAAGVAILLGCAAGAINGFLVAYAGLPSMVVTLATLVLFRGAAYIVLGGEAVTAFPPWFTSFGFNRLGDWPLPLTVLLFVPFTVAGMVTLGATGLGRRIYALGARPQVARFSGISVPNIKFGLYVLSGAVAALAGLMLTARISSARADNATGWELPIIAAVLLGGVNIYGGGGTLFGPLVAVLVFGALGNALGLANISTQSVQIIIGVVLIGSVLITNLFGAQDGQAGRPRLSPSNRRRTEPASLRRE